MGTNKSLTGNLTIPQYISANDYDALDNKPQINGVTLTGDKSFEELFPNILDDYSKIYYATTEQWAAEPGLITEENAIYVYRDRYVIDGYNIPGFKIGDGQAYLIDAPFADEYIQTQIDEHIEDTVSHVTQEERNYWNAKSRIIQDGEMLIITD